MNVKDYRYVVEIAEQRSISKAAATLYITQSALTKFLQRVEAELGTPLFFRQGNHLMLTEIGQYYVDKGKKIVELDYEIEKEISRIVDKNKSYIRIGYGSGRSDYVIRAVLQPFFKSYQDVQVDALVRSTEKCLKMVENNELDLAIVTSRDYRPGLVYLHAGDSPWILAVPQTSRLIEAARKEDGMKYPIIELAEWIKEPFILPSAVTYSGKLVREFFKKSHAVPNVCLKITDVKSVMKAVESGIGNSIFWGVPREGMEIEYLFMKEFELPPQSLYVAYRSDLCISSPMHYMIQLIKNAFQE